MTTVPSLIRWVRESVRVNARRSVAPSGRSRVTAGPARKRASGVWPVSLCALRLYSYSHHACVASLSCSSVRSATPSSMASRRPSTFAHSTSIFPFCAGVYGKVVSCKMPRRASPSVTSAAHMAAPLSLIAARGRPRRMNACDNPCTMFCAHSAPRYHCRWQARRERSSSTPKRTGVTHSPRAVRTLRDPT